MSRRRVVRTAGAVGIAVSAWLALAASPAQPAATPSVRAYASSQTIPATGSLPRGGSAGIGLVTGRGEREGAWIVARGGGKIAVAIDRGTLGSIGLELAWGHYVQVGDRVVPDALVPWDGSAHDAERDNQPVYVRVAVPPTVTAGTYSASILVTTAAGTTKVPLSVRVFPFTFGASGTRRPLTSFHVSPTTYLSTVARLSGLSSTDQRRAAVSSLYAFLADYGLSPSSWGFGEPRSAAGYASSPQVVARLGDEHARRGEQRRLQRDADPDLEQPQQAAQLGRRTRSRAARRAGATTSARSASLLGAAGLAHALGAVPLRPGRADGRRPAARRAAVEGAPRVLAGRAVGDDRQPAAEGRESLPLRRQERGRPRHLGRSLTSLVRPVHGAPSRAVGPDPGPGSRDVDRTRPQPRRRMDVHVRRGFRHPGVRRARTAVEPAHVPPLERPRGNRRSPVRRGDDELRRTEPARAAVSPRRVRAPLPERRAADPERAARADPRRPRGLDAVRRAPAPDRRARRPRDPRRCRPVQRRSGRASTSRATWAASFGAGRSTRGRAGRTTRRPRPGSSERGSLRCARCARPVRSSRAGGCPRSRR